MKIGIYILFFGLNFLFTACASKPYLKQNSALIVFKTPTFKYADMGFIYENKEEIKAEVYSAGQALMTLKISRNDVCMSLFECMSKENFNKQILHHLYPQNIIDNIFRAKPIFEAQGLVYRKIGFMQKIVKGDKYNIYYAVSNKETLFHDIINGILIKVKRRER